MQSGIFLSVIIPVYNSSVDELTRCMNSISHITAPCEIVVIDDGSEPYIGDYFKKVSNVKYYRQNNGGVSKARNKGIELARGKYIAFLDADDCYTKEFCDFINDKYADLEDDFYLFNIKEIDSSRKILHRVIFTHESRTQKDDILKIIINTKSLNECWGKLFKRDIIQRMNVRFPEKVIIGEDVQFVVRFLACVDTIKVFDFFSYDYYIPESQHGRVVKNPDMRIQNIKERYEELKKVAVTTNSYNTLDRLLSKWVINIIVHDVISYMQFDKWNQDLKNKVKEQLIEDINPMRTKFSVKDGVAFYIKYLLIKYEFWNGMRLIAKTRHICRKG